MSSPNIGFKSIKVSENKFALVTLQILGQNNEDRKDIFDFNHAKFRCSEAFVESIVSIPHRIPQTEGYSEYKGKKFEYRVGEIVKVERWNEKKKNEVCSEGIHYFKSEEPAWFYHYQPLNGEYKEWWFNGKLKIEANYKKGELKGEYKEWYSNGKLKIEANYKKEELQFRYLYQN